MTFSPNILHIYIYIYIYIYNILGWVKHFAMFWYVLVYGVYCHMTEAVQIMEVTCCGWQYHGNWCVDTLCIASLFIWFESTAVQK